MWNFDSVFSQAAEKGLQMSQYSVVPAEYEREADVEYARTAPVRSRKHARPSYARGGARPNAYNGIHRRRRKHWTW